jgi:hypothetical protein
MIWSTVEIGIGITAGCIATLRPVWQVARSRSMRISATALLGRKPSHDIGGQMVDTSKRNTLSSEQDPLRHRLDSVTTHAVVAHGKPAVAAPVRPPRPSETEVQKPAIAQIQIPRDAPRTIQIQQQMPPSAGHRKISRSSADLIRSLDISRGGVYRQDEAIGPDEDEDEVSPGGSSDYGVPRHDGGDDWHQPSIESEPTSPTTPVPYQPTPLRPGQIPKDLQDEWAARVPFM